MSKKPFIIIAVLICVIALPVAKKYLGKGDIKEIETETLQYHNIQSSVLASGKLVHEEEVMLSTEEIGKVTAIYVEEGDQVSKGQLLLQIDDEAYVAAVEQNRATVRMQEIAIQRQKLRIDNLDSQWHRKKKMFERNLLDGSQDAFDLATNELEIARVDLNSARESLLQAQAQLEQTENRLSKTRAYSPIDGVVTSLDIKVGETAISSTTNIPGSSLMTIANPDSIHTEVNVDEADIANVQIGQKAKIYAIAYPDQPIEGVVNSIAVSAKVAEGSQGLSFAVKIRFTDSNTIVLRPGMSCRAEIFTATLDEVLAVPIQAILVEEDRTRNQTDYHVFINADGKARKIQVQVGMSDDSYQEVSEGVDEGDEIIIGPDRILQHLNNDEKVTMIED